MIIPEWLYVYVIFCLIKVFLHPLNPIVVPVFVVKNDRSKNMSSSLSIDNYL